MKKFILSLSLTIVLLHSVVETAFAVDHPTWWNFQAIDTMKYSRDPSRQFLSNPTEMNEVIEQQVKEVAAAGATHIAIATPYDAEFLPVLNAWVAAARQHQLKIWYRGNWSGWEGWFGYQRISRDEHLAKTIQFIKDHPELFEDDDVFSACPECENGGPGDPRMNGDAAGHRAFLIKEYQAMGEAFRGINRNVQVNFNSMNGDVARLIMDKETTQALGGIVVVDHYVRSPEQLSNDITAYAERSGGKVVLGEFGAPIPDIHGQMSDQQQAAWIDQAMKLLARNPAVYGVSYWTGVGGSTALWREDGTPKPAVAVVKKYFSPQVITGSLTNTLDQAISGSTISSEGRTITVPKNGGFTLPYLENSAEVTFTAPGYQPQQTSLTALGQYPRVKLTPTNPGLLYRLRVWIHQYISGL